MFSFVGVAVEPEFVSKCLLGVREGMTARAVVAVVVEAAAAVAAAEMAAEGAVVVTGMHNFVL